LETRYGYSLLEAAIRKAMLSMSPGSLRAPQTP